MGGDKDLNPLPDVDVVNRIGTETGLNVGGTQPGRSNYISESLIDGKSVIMTMPGNGQVAHSVSVKGAYVKQVQNDIINVKIKFVFIISKLKKL